MSPNASCVDDILGAPVVRNRINVEIPLPQAPLEVEEEEEEEGKEEEQENEAETEQTAVDKTESRMVVYKATESASIGNVESDDDAPLTKREFKQIQNTLNQLLSLLMQD